MEVRETSGVNISGAPPLPPAAFSESLVKYGTFETALRFFRSAGLHEKQ